MEEALRSLLKNAAPVVALASTRIDWGARQQGKTGPAVVLHRIGGRRGQHLQGPDGLISSRVQIDCWAASYGSAKALARVVITALNGHRDTTFQRVFIEAERDDHDLTPPEPLFRTSLDLLIWHT